MVKKHFVSYFKEIINQKKNVFKLAWKRKKYWYAIVNNLDKFKINNFIIAAKYHYLDSKKYYEEYKNIQKQNYSKDKKSFEYWDKKGFSMPPKYVEMVVIDWLFLFNGDMNKVVNHYIQNYNKIRLSFFSRYLLEKELGLNIVPNKYYGFTLQQYGRIVGKSEFDENMKDIFSYVYDIDYDVYDEIITKYDEERKKKNYVSKYIS